MAKNGDVRRGSDNFDKYQKEYAKKEKELQKQLKKKEKELKKAELENQNTEHRLQLIQASKDREINNQISEMNHQWLLFEKGLDMENWDKAQALWAKLEKENHPQEMLKINTRKIFEQQFAFDDVAKNDFAVAHLENLETAQINLNNNTDNKILLDKFIQTAQDTAEALIKEYPDVWHDPAIDVKKERRNQQLAVQEKNQESNW